MKHAIACLGLGVMVLCAALAEGATAAPATAPATTRAAEIPDVRSLEELKKLPAHQAAGWEVRLGLADAGPAGGPWVILYCQAEPTTAREYRVSPDGEEILGPFSFDVRWDKEQIAVCKISRDSQLTPARSSLFAATIPIGWEGGCRIRVLDPDGRLLATRDITAKKADWYWMNFGTYDNKVAAVAHAAMPTMPQDTPLIENLGEVKRLDGRGLPGQLPPDQAWFTAPAGKPMANEMKKGEAGGLMLKLDDNQLLVITSHGGKMIDWPDRNLLARWWINDRPVLAAMSDMDVMMEAARRVGHTESMSVRLGLPKVVNAKAGDKIGLQIMYTPEGWRWPRKYVLQDAIAASAKDEARIPLISNRIEFKATQEMITARDAK